jgi:hypothetical protein
MTEARPCQIQNEKFILMAFTSSALQANAKTGLDILGEQPSRRKPEITKSTLNLITRQIPLTPWNAK